MSHGHGGPGQVLGVEEVESGVSRDLGGEVASDGGDPVVRVDDATIRQVASDVLVLDGLDQAELSDGSVSDWSHHSNEYVLISSAVSHHMHVLILNMVSLASRLLLQSHIE